MLLVFHWGILSLAEIRIFIVELLITSFKKIHLLVEDLWIKVLVKVSVDFSHCLPHSGSSELAEFAVQNNDLVTTHDRLDSFSIFEEIVFHLVSRTKVN